MNQSLSFLFMALLLFTVLGVNKESDLSSEDSFLMNILKKYDKDQTYFFDSDTYIEVLYEIIETGMKLSSQKVGKKGLSLLRNAVVEFVKNKPEEI